MLAALSLKVTMTQARPSREPVRKVPVIIQIVSPYQAGGFIETEVRESEPETTNSDNPQDEETKP